MNLSRRNMLKAGAAALVTAPLTTKADANDFWNQHRRPIPQSMKDGPSSALDASGVVTMPARQVPVYRKCDVLVVGGGIAGWAAALAAARAGSKTILLERDEALGGLWSNGGVLILLSTGFMQDGKYFQTTRGFTDELEKRLLAMGPHGITARKDDKRLWHPTADPEALKIALEEMLAEAGCEVLYRCHGIDVVQDGNALKGAVVETKEGRLAVLARQIVDATGDGDVLFQAGENYQQYLHGVGFTWRIGGYDKMDLVKLRKAGLWGGGEEPCSDTRWYGEFGVPMNCFDVAGISKVLAKHRRTARRTSARCRAASRRTLCGPRLRSASAARGRWTDSSPSTVRGRRRTRTRAIPSPSWARTPSRRAARACRTAALSRRKWTTCSSPAAARPARTTWWTSSVSSPRVS